MQLNPCVSIVYLVLNATNRMGQNQRRKHTRWGGGGNKWKGNEERKKNKELLFWVRKRLYRISTAVTWWQNVVSWPHGQEHGFWDQIDLQWNLKYSITRANYTDGNEQKVPGIYQHTSTSRSLYKHGLSSSSWHTENSSIVNSILHSQEMRSPRGWVICGGHKKEGDSGQALWLQGLCVSSTP